MRKILIGFAGLVLAAGLATPAHAQQPKRVTCNNGLTFIADIYTDRVLMGEGYIVDHWGRRPPVSRCCAGFRSPREANPLQHRRVRLPSLTR